jgi:hypothetical protein
VARPFDQAVLCVARDLGVDPDFIFLMPPSLDLRREACGSLRSRDSKRAVCASMRPPFAVAFPLISSAVRHVSPSLISAPGSASASDVTIIRYSI